MTLKNIYNLSYDSSGFNSSLITWYNELIDKTYEELNNQDVARMIRQDILKKIATKKAVDLFFSDPYDGEYDDGELLNLLVSLELDLEESTIQKLKNRLQNLRSEYLEFEFDQEESKELFKENIDKMILKLN